MSNYARRGIYPFTPIASRAVSKLALKSFQTSFVRFSGSLGRGLLFSYFFLIFTIKQSKNILKVAVSGWKKKFKKVGIYVDKRIKSRYIEYVLNLFNTWGVYEG